RTSGCWKGCATWNRPMRRNSTGTPWVVDADTGRREISLSARVPGSERSLPDSGCPLANPLNHDSSSRRPSFSAACQEAGKLPTQKTQAEFADVLRVGG